MFRKLFIGTVAEKNSVMAARALHYVFRVANRKESYDFYTGVLGMKVLRHEEFSKGCEATCNGKYDGRWSKTMIGYGPEDKHFVLEITYNYDVGSYDLGNDYEAIHITDDGTYERVKDSGTPGPNSSLVVKDPDGHNFYIYKGKVDYPVQRVTCNVKDLKKSVWFWSEICKMEVKKSTDSTAELSFGPDQCTLELQVLKPGVELNRGTAYGRIAFAYPTDSLPELQKRVESEDEKYIQNKLIKLDTPGKASVYVIILRDPNEHEICFVGEEAYWSLSAFDPNGDKLIKDAMASDDSDEWYAKKGKTKAAGTA